MRGMGVKAWIAFAFCMFLVLACSQVSAQPSCTIRTYCIPGEEVNLFQMSATSNAHASVDDSYPYKVCCGNMEDPGTDCVPDDKNLVLRLYQESNSHVETREVETGNYNIDVCLNSRYGIDCRSYGDYCSGLLGDYVCVASVSAYTNAHVGGCDAYDIKICCQEGGKQVPIGSVIINDDEEYAQSGQVVLSIETYSMEREITECGYSNDGISYDWEPCIQGEWTKDWELSGGDGEKTVYFQVRDDAGSSTDDSDSIILDTTGPVARIQPPLPEYTGPMSVIWEGSADGSSKAFNVSWAGEDVSGIACYRVQYNTSTLPWTDWMIEGSDCTPRGEWAFGPLEPLALQEGENYSFRVRALDNAGMLGGWSPDNHTTLDTLVPGLDPEALDQDDNDILGMTVVSYPDVENVTAVSSATDTVSGIRDNHIYYCRIYGGAEDCRTEYCSPKGPGEVSSCNVTMDYGKDVVIKFRASSEDYAGNANMTPGGLDRYFFVTDHALANFLVYQLDMVIGNGALLRVQARNLQDRFDNITLNISVYKSASFVDTGDMDLDLDKRTLWLGLNPYEEREVLVRVLPSSPGHFTLYLNATSSLTEDGEPCDVTDCVTDSDIVFLIMEYTPEFPGLNIWAVILLVVLSLVLYSRVGNTGLKSG